MKALQSQFLLILECFALDWICYWNWSSGCLINNGILFCWRHWITQRLYSWFGKHPMLVCELVSLIVFFPMNKITGSFLMIYDMGTHHLLCCVCIVLRTSWTSHAAYYILITFLLFFAIIYAHFSILFVTFLIREQYLKSLGSISNNLDLCNSRTSQKVVVAADFAPWTTGRHLA